MLQAEVVEKGAVQGIVLWKNKHNLNGQRMIDGVWRGHSLISSRVRASAR